MQTTATYRSLFILTLVYVVASLVHFVHNAEFLADYPNLPQSWTRGHVYGAWVVLTAVGAAGWLLLLRGMKWPGLILLDLYAMGGFFSFGHYILAPMSQHTAMMNATILAELTAAAMLMIGVAYQMVRKGEEKLRA